jgi:hypothetical protein
MATQAEIEAIANIILRVFERDPQVFEASLEAIKVNTDKITIDNRIAEIRKEIRVFTEAKEAEIQELLGMK